VVEGVLVIAVTVALSFMAPHTNDNAEAVTADGSSAFDSSEEGITAGVAGALQSIEVQTSEKLGEQVCNESDEIDYVSAAMTADTDEQSVESDANDQNEPSEVVAEDDTEAVTSGETEPVEEASLTEEEQEWLGYLMPDVKNSLNVRTDASEDSDIVGKLYKGDRAVIVEQGDEWTKITSGNVEGYVKNSLCVFGLDALAYAKENCDLVAKCTIDGLRVRKEASLDGAVATRLDKDAKLTVDKDAEETDGWVAVRYNDTTCYVSADYVTVSLNLGTGVTLAEEKAQKAAAAAAASSKSKKKSSSRKICDLAYEVDEVTLLAGIIECEAGTEDYEAMLAVGAVVMNRVNSSQYPDNIFDVIHQKGQFPPATSGSLEKRLKKGPCKKAIKAAKAAIAGEDNTGGKMGFQMASTGHSGTVIGDNVFY
jgi:spore germination cell wall hydrolase CwlJ-like protein/SH3-like domain-containing protein